MSNKEFRIKKLLFRSSHRGTKEMDLILGGFFKKFAHILTENELTDFEKLLEIDDKYLNDFFVMGKKSNSVEKITISKKIQEYIS